MTEVVDKIIGVCSGIVIAVSCCSLVLTLMRTAQDPIIKQRSDKTYIESPGVQDVTLVELTGRDILFSLVNTDEMTPYPRAIRWVDSSNPSSLTPIIQLNNEFLARKMELVSYYYSSTGPYKLRNYLDRKVIKEEYVYWDGIPYLLYTF